MPMNSILTICRVKYHLLLLIWTSHLIISFDSPQFLYCKKWQAVHPPHSFFLPLHLLIASLSSLCYFSLGSGILAYLSIPDMKAIPYLQLYLLTFSIPCIMLLYPFWEQHTVFRVGVYQGFIQWGSFTAMNYLVSSAANSITFWKDAKRWQKSKCKSVCNFGDLPLVLGLHIQA